VVTTALGWPDEEDEDEDEEDGDGGDSDAPEDGGEGAEPPRKQARSLASMTGSRRSVRDEAALEHLRELAIPHKARMAARAAVEAARLETRRHKLLLGAKKKKKQKRRGERGAPLEGADKKGGKRKGKGNKSKHSKGN